MTNKINVVVIIGTRPEAIKMAPVILELKKYPNKFETVTILTAQHRQMLDQVLTGFAIKADFDLSIMTANQSLDQILSRAHVGVGELLETIKPGLVLVQGDTTTSMAAALAAYHHRIPLGHVEAGLRSFDKDNPFPEEINRTVTDSIADFAFAPTKVAAANLLKIGIPKENIFITGNTVVDSLLAISGKSYNFSNPLLTKIDFSKRKVLLLTTHRRENYLDGGMKNIFTALNRLVKEHSDLQIVFPVHLNPNVRNLVEQNLNSSQQIILTEPLDYLDLVKLLKNCYLVLTDSGGIQEEAPTFGKPVLILRKVTERPEGVQSGVEKLVGTDEKLIFTETNNLVTNKDYYRSMISKHNPYGDGKASERIVQVIMEKL